MAFDGLAGIPDESSKAVSHGYLFRVEGGFFLDISFRSEEQNQNSQKKRISYREFTTGFTAVR
jgi:hypothetical protein